MVLTGLDRTYTKENRRPVSIVMNLKLKLYTMVFHKEVYLGLYCFYYILMNFINALITVLHFILLITQTSIYLWKF